MSRALALAALLAAAGAAQACGVCVEDKMAAVYDHAVVTQALGRQHHVAFFHVEGALGAGEATKKALQKAAESSAAVDRGGVRVSVESASLSVAFDPRRTPVMGLQKDLERRLAGKKYSLVLMQVIRQPSDIGPSVQRALRARGS
jgi:hypothetical protein